jgi:hypothetical protein
MKEPTPEQQQLINQLCNLEAKITELETHLTSARFQRKAAILQAQETGLSLYRIAQHIGLGRSYVGKLVKK